MELPGEDRHQIHSAVPVSPFFSSSAFFAFSAVKGVLSVLSVLCG